MYCSLYTLAYIENPETLTIQQNLQAQPYGCRNERHSEPFLNPLCNTRPRMLERALLG